MNIALWIVQVALAAMFAMAGVTKLTKPRADLFDQLPWADDFSDTTVKTIGAAELAAATGLILPALTGIAPVLTPLAATGLAIIMILAAITHVRRREPVAIGFNVILLAAAAFVAWGRLGPHPL